jgi:fermentation-respiration switch protein FrsA (DUF1100 family)
MLYETPVVFWSNGISLVGRFYRNTSSIEDRQATIIVTGSWLTVKEQMPAVYAKRLAEAGYTAFTFDFSGFGESHGIPQQAEIPERKINDIIAAAEFIATMSFVDRNKIGHLAICASAQYALAAIARGAGTNSFASIAGWFHDAKSVSAFYGGADGVALRIGRAREAVERYIKSGEVTIVPAYEAGDDRAGMFFPLDYYANTDRGAIHAWKNQMAEMSWLYWLTYDGLSAADEIITPVLFVHGDECVLPENVKNIYARLRGQKEMVWMEGSQVDFYDQPKLVDKAVAAAVSWFDRTLRKGKEDILKVA